MINQIINGFWAIVVAITEHPITQIILNIVAIMSLIISIRTMIIASKFRERLAERDGKKMFFEARDLFSGKLEGYIGNFSKDKLYVPMILEEGLIEIKKFESKFRNVDDKMSKQLIDIANLMTKKCIPESKEKKELCRMKLCEKLIELQTTVNNVEVF